MNINYQYSDIVPQFVVCNRNLGRNEYTINFDVEELGKRDRTSDKKYRFQSISLPPGKFDRNTVISKLVCSHYTNDEMTAVINNYLLDDGDEESIAEFKEMQAWRKHSKEIADKFEAFIAG